MKKVKITLPWRRESLSEVGAVPAVGAKNLTLYLGYKRSHTLWVGYRSLAYTAVLQIFGPSDLFHRGFYLFLCNLYAFMKLFAINGVYMKALGTWKMA